MTDLRKAAEALMKALDDGWVERGDSVVIALRQALAQPEQEPVAWIRSGDDQLSLTKGENDGYMIWRPLYTAPPKREWVGLTHDEVPEQYKDDSVFCLGWEWAENKLKEKNA